MRSIFKSLTLLLVILIGCCSCSKEVEKANSAIKNQDSPRTVMDMFDGERKVWFAIEKSYDTEVGLSYDDEIECVLVVENKSVVAFYYNLMDSGRNTYIMNGVECTAQPHPFLNERFILSDFEGMTDNEIISEVAQTYGDASLEYTISYDFVPGSDDSRVEGDYVLPAHSFPYLIEYDGDLDSSGNNLESETLYFGDSGFEVEVGFGNYHYSECVDYLKRFPAITVIEPTIIKDKTYVGFKDARGNMIVTTNSYGLIDNIGYDSPDGVKEE